MNTIQNKQTKEPEIDYKKCWKATCKEAKEWADKYYNCRTQAISEFKEKLKINIMVDKEWSLYKISKIIDKIAEEMKQ